MLPLFCILVCLLELAAAGRSSIGTGAYSYDYKCRDAGVLGLLGRPAPLDGYCDVYVQCGATSSVVPCTAGQFFNGQRCVNCHLASCPYDPCISQADGVRIADRQTCNGFYTCISGRSVYDKCPAGHRFSQGRCLFDNTCSTGLIQTNVDSCDGYNYIASPQFPEVFFQREASGVYRERPCPTGLVFDTSVCVCNYPDDYYLKNQVQSRKSGGRFNKHWNY